MKSKALIFALMLSVILIISNCIKDKSIPTSPSDESNQDNQDSMVVKKPNIYIYPTQIEQLQIKVLFLQGGRIINSEPLYENGWNISVDTSGTINNKFRYLFYECKLPNRFQTNKGWLVARNDLTLFFNENMKKFGFNDVEIKDFIEYWIPILTKYQYYLIYPQKTDIINQLLELQISKEPDSIQRLYYLFKGVNMDEIGNLQEPQISEFTRKGFAVVEWGGIFSE